MENLKKKTDFGTKWIHVVTNFFLYSFCQFRGQKFAAKDFSFPMIYLMLGFTAVFYLYGLFEVQANLLFFVCYIG